jgi:hypothetical protein
MLRERDRSPSRRSGYLIADLTGARTMTMDEPPGLKSGGHDISASHRSPATFNGILSVIAL